VGGLIIDMGRSMQVRGGQMGFSFADRHLQHRNHIKQQPHDISMAGATRSDKRRPTVGPLSAAA